MEKIFFLNANQIEAITWFLIQAGAMVFTVVKSVFYFFGDRLTGIEKFSAENALEIQRVRENTNVRMENATVRIEVLDANISEIKDDVKEIKRLLYETK